MNDIMIEHAESSFRLYWKNRKKCNFQFLFFILHFKHFGRYKNDRPLLESLIHSSKIGKFWSEIIFSILNKISIKNQWAEVLTTVKIGKQIYLDKQLIWKSGKIISEIFQFFNNEIRFQISMFNFQEIIRSKSKKHLFGKTSAVGRWWAFSRGIGQIWWYNFSYWIESQYSEDKIWILQSEIIKIWREFFNQNNFLKSIKYNLQEMYKLLKNDP
jgi:hypothetical protein